MDQNQGAQWVKARLTHHRPLSREPLFPKHHTNWEAIGGMYDSGVPIRTPLGRHKSLPKGLACLEGIKPPWKTSDRLSAYLLPAA